VSSTYVVRVNFRQYPSIFADSATITVDGCTFNPCRNGAVCASADNTCACALGFTGVSCQTNLCAGISCGNSGGLCSPSLSVAAGMGVCACPTGYSGTYCEVAPASGCTVTCGRGGAVNSGCTGCNCVQNSFWQGATCNTCTYPCVNGGVPSETCDSCVCPAVCTFVFLFVFCSPSSHLVCCGCLLCRTGLWRPDVWQLHSVLAVASVDCIQLHLQLSVGVHHFVPK
jgi:hypothetical protein